MTSTYLRWLGDQLSVAAPDVRRAAGRFDPDLVIGYATGYGPGAMSAFVRSLRAVYGGRIALYVDPGRPDVDELLEAHGVDRLTLGRNGGGWRPHPAVERFGAYLSGLDAYPEARRVLMTDVRDVVFQDHPLQEPVAELEFYPESGDDTLAEDPKNLAWLRRLVGEPIADQLLGRTCICAGTIIGHADEVRRLCRLLLFLGGIPRSGHGGAFGADQAACNLSVYLGLCPGEVRPNFTRVATLQRTPSSSLRVEGGRLLNPDGSISPIVHKYDRHPVLLAAVEARWSPDFPAGLAPTRRPVSSFFAHAARGIGKRLPELR